MTPFAQGELTASQANELNRAIRRLDALDRLTVAAPLNLSRAAGIPVISLSGLAAGEDEQLAVVVSSTGTPPVHTVTTKTRDGSNNVVDTSPLVTYTKVLNPAATAYANGTLVAIFPIIGQPDYWWAIPATASSGGGLGTPFSATLSSTYNLTGSMADTGLSVSIPGAGTYLLFATVSGNMSITDTGSGSDYILEAQLVDGSGTLLSDVVTVTTWQIVSFPNPSPLNACVLNAAGTATIPIFYVASGANTVHLQGRYQGTTGTRNGATFTTTGIPGGTNIRGVKLG